MPRAGRFALGLRRPASARSRENTLLCGEIARIHRDSDRTYGWRRVHAALRREGHEVNHKHVERLMRSERLAGAHVRPRRRGGDRPLGVAGVRAWPDLVGRDFQPAAPNQLWCADLE